MSAYTHNLVAGDDSIRAVLDYARKVAATECTTLLTGETGTGKEAVAEFIHAHSARRARPFVSINCAALPEGLFESELFGFERGAFTGAVRAYPGKLKLAQGGTVLLDEIGELPLPAQAKLLRAIEAREVSRLGGRQSEPIDVRFVAATNQDLESLVAQQRFRADLFFRLNVARIHLPPLRQRPRDIPALFAHYWRAFAPEHAARPLADSALACLLRYHWPGNVRELRNVVEALLIDPPTGPIESRHLPATLTGAVEPSADGDERQRILAALFATRWNKCRAAQELHWSRMTLYRKMSKYCITRSN